MGTKDTVRALLDRLPDDCTIRDVIEELCLLEGEDLRDGNLPPLTAAQREELDRRIDAYERNPEPGVPWREALRKIERGE